MKNEIYVRHPSRISEEKLSKRLGLFWDEETQDWDLIVSDPSKLDIFLNVYQTELKDDDDKFTLMGLIIASFDDCLEETNTDFEKKWKVCRTILEKECFLHYSSIMYWSFLEGKDEESIFSLTPYMREVLKNVAHRFK